MDRLADAPGVGPRPGLGRSALGPAERVGAVAGAEPRAQNHARVWGGRVEWSRALEVSIGGVQAFKFFFLGQDFILACVGSDHSFRSAGWSVGRLVGRSGGRSGNAGQQSQPHLGLGLRVPELGKKRTPVSV